MCNVAYKHGKLKTIFIPFLLVLEFCKQIFALTIILHYMAGANTFVYFSDTWNNT